jgi:putative oxidoreductase
VTRLTLRSTFPIFPDGAPGVGLLLLRAIGGGALLFFGSVSWMARHELNVLALTLATVSLAAGLLLLLGLFTSVVCTLSALVSVEALFSLVAPVPMVNIITAKLSAVFTAVVTVALLCLGPGAYSLDARRHGRREIVIPARPRASDESSS